MNKFDASNLNNSSAVSFNARLAPEAQGKADAHNAPKAKRARNAKASPVTISAGMDPQAAKDMLIEALGEQSARNIQIKRTREQLATLAAVIFAGVKVATADAAAALGLELSVKHLDKGMTTERAFVQGQRVTLQRALKDAGVLKVDESKGRKAGASKDSTEASGEEADGKKAGQLGVVLRALSFLTEDELDEVAEAIAELHMAAL